MLPRSTTLAAAAAAALIAAAPAAASSGGSGPVAHAAGGDPLPPIPSLVQTRITRTENAIERLTNYVDDGDTAGVTRTGKVIRRQLAAAWRGAVYYVKNPPVVIEDDAAPAAKAAQDDETPLVADQFTTAAAVFQTYHEAAATMVELTDGARVPVLNDMSRTLFWTLDSRDKAVAAAHALEPPPDPEGEGGEDAVSFATVMPTVIPMLDDEMQQIKGLQSDAKDLRPGGTRILADTLTKTLATETTINTIWPPVIDD